MFKRMRSVSLAILASTALTCVYPTAPVSAQSAARPADTVKVNLPTQEFTLPNGLRVIVATDHTTPVVAVNIWYHVGSRNELPGKTGFAHLYEHLMFQGSENHRDDFFRPFEPVGGSKYNGTTSQDRTNFYETVPTPALDMTLWLESDRMGHLLGAIDQATLDEQRGVVQNEKRQRFGQPYGLVPDHTNSVIFPEGHPYHHAPVGSMADLNAASLADVKAWFRSWYGPNNAVLVLAGDIDFATAKEKVTRYFGDIAPSAAVERAAPDIPKRAQDTREVFPDRVPQVVITRTWPAPGLTNPDAAALRLLAYILGSSGSSRLHTRLVEREQLLTSVSTTFAEMEIAGTFTIVASLKDGVDPARVEKAIDEEVTRILREGPTAAELERARTVTNASWVRGLETNASRAELLNYCVTYYGRSDCWRDVIDATARLTPANMQAAAARWLGRGSHTIEVTKSDIAAASKPEIEAPVVRTPAVVPPPDPRFSALPTGVDRSAGLPKVSGFPDLKLPPFKRATLSNGIEVVLAESHSIPTVTISMSFPPGSIRADYLAGGRQGRASLAMDMLIRGAGPYDATQFAARADDLGMQLGTSADPRAASVSINSLTSKLPESLDLMADMLLRPRFDAGELARLQASTIASIKQARSNASRAAVRLLPTLVYGEANPYGPLATEASISRLTRDDLVSYHRDRLTPASARITVVGDTTLAEIVPLLEARFGAWMPESASPTDRAIPVPVQRGSRVYLIDQPGAPQSTIIAAQLIPAFSNDAANDAMDVANSALGVGFTSRVNMDLREDKHWSYGAASAISDVPGPRVWRVQAPVQADRTADAMRAIDTQIKGLAGGTAPVTATELARIKGSILYGQPSTYENSGMIAVLIDALRSKGLPDNYLELYTDRLTHLSPDEATKAFAQTINPNALTWIVVGPLDMIEKQVRALNLGEVIVIDADGKPVKRN